MLCRDFWVHYWAMTCGWLYIFEWLVVMYKKQCKAHISFNKTHILLKWKENFIFGKLYWKEPSEWTDLLSWIVQHYLRHPLTVWLLLQLICKVHCFQLCWATVTLLKSVVTSVTSPVVWHPVWKALAAERGLWWGEKSFELCALTWGTKVSSASLVLPTCSFSGCNYLSHHWKIGVLLLWSVL